MELNSCKSGNILVIDDDRDTCELLAAHLATGSHRVTWRMRSDEALELLRDEDFDLILTDLKLGTESGIELCKQCTRNRPNTPVLVVTGFGDMQSAIDAMRAGAYDYLTKPLEMPQLDHAIARALEGRRLMEQLRRFKVQSPKPLDERLGALVGKSHAMAAVYDQVRRVAMSETTVLLSGESGTGKELVARALHECSGRSGQLVAINCAAVPSELLESELFGHVRGAFTDAGGSRVGLFEQASGGTLLLDEIGELPIALQAKLLRVLQERQVRAVGSNDHVAVTARIIAATNRDLEAEVEARRFREDLFYRLNVFQVHVPPLRARGNDILLLADYFLRRFAERSKKSINGIGHEAQRKLVAYNWPGNVRQLENVIERAVALTLTNQIEIVDLAEAVVTFDGWSPSAQEADLENLLTLEQLERRHIDMAVRRYGGNKTQAAKELGIDRRTIYRKLARYDGDLRQPGDTQISGREAPNTARAHV
jgi:two-component system response regulator HydG